MNILLIQPNSVEEVNKKYLSFQYPINLGYIAAVLEREGHVVGMVDFNTVPRSELPNFISKHNPGVVGLTAMTSSIYNASNIISEIKGINPKIITVLGGVHASALPEQTMRDLDKLDYLVFGEGERTIAELVRVIANRGDLKSVKGIVFKKDGEIIKNEPRELIENLDEIPFPARHLIPLELYEKHHVTRGFSRKEVRAIEIMTTRGCPNRCIFCAGHINYGQRVRFRSYENITKEMQECIEKYGAKHFSIEDDTFTLSRDLVIRLCGFFKKNRLTWNCNARVNCVDDELLKIMARSGCKKVAFGIEAGNQEILNKIKKGITVPQAIKAVKSAKKAGIRYVECDFMIGSHVDETVDDVLDSVKLIYELMPDFLAVSIMCPYPGTEIYSMMMDRRYLHENPDWSKFSHFGALDRYKRITNMTTEQMSALQHKILKDYYASPRYIFSQLIQIRTLKEVKYFLRMGILFLKEFIFKK